MNNEYFESIIGILPDFFEGVFVLDTLKDIEIEYKIDNKELKEVNRYAFTTRFADIEKLVHTDDIKEMIDCITINNFGPGEIKKCKYRKKNEEGIYNWYTNVSKVIKDSDGNDVVLLLITPDKFKSITVENSPREEELEKKIEVILDSVADTIIKLNRVVDINVSSRNPEIRGIIEYVNNATMDLSNSYPELCQKVSESMLTDLGEGEKTLLIVDDDNVTCDILKRCFIGSYKVKVCSNGEEVIKLIDDNLNERLEKKIKIVGMFLDLNMPGVDGFDVLNYLASKNLITKMPIIIISGDNQEVRNKAYNYPIADVLEKPFTVPIVKHRMNNLIKIYKSNNSLNEIVLTQHEDIKNVLRVILKSYLLDCETGLKRISTYTNIIMKQVSDDYEEYRVDNERLEKITEASKYYDIGVFTLPKKILKKKEYTEEDLQIINSSTQIGLTIFDSILYRNTDRIFNHYVKDMISFHQENYDGSGLPNKVEGDSIPISAQVLKIAVDFNDMETKELDNPLEIIKKGSGTLYNPKVVQSFEKVYDQLLKVKDIVK